MLGFSPAGLSNSVQAFKEVRVEMVQGWEIASQVIQKDDDTTEQNGMTATEDQVKAGRMGETKRGLERQETASKERGSELWISEVDQTQAGALQSCSPTPEHPISGLTATAFSVAPTCSELCFLLLSLPAISFSLGLTTPLFPSPAHTSTSSPFTKISLSEPSGMNSDSCWDPDLPTYTSCQLHRAFTKIKLKPNIHGFLSFSKITIQWKLKSHTLQNHRNFKWKRTWKIHQSLQMKLGANLAKSSTAGKYQRERSLGAAPGSPNTNSVPSTTLGACLDPPHAPYILSNSYLGFPGFSIHSSFHYWHQDLL